MEKRQVLRFGIQSLDRLIGTVRSKPSDEPRYGIDLGDPPFAQDTEPDNVAPPVTSSICLAGPDGTGKSVLSLHLAAHYLADCLAECVEAGRPIPKDLKVLYISTDLTYNMAFKGWKHFALNYPLERSEPLVELKEGKTKRDENARIKIGLEQYFPAGDEASPQSIVRYLEDYEHTHASPIKADVCFVDLASRTAGDDWGFVHRLVSSLEEPAATEPRHLVILDAVEGFETLVGDLNAFGEKSSRRSRIAQVMRLAAGRCHLLLVVEEARRQRFPEEFVTDVVIRLRNVDTGRYVRRTVDIEKARGQAHKRGQHPYVIRDGTGSSTTGSRDNADDPAVFRDKAKTKNQGYVHVFPSLDYMSREAMIDRSAPLNTPDKTRFAAFGLPYLDNMLGGKGEKAERNETEGFDTRGLPCSSATALIGDSLTQKSRLGKAFLSRGFYSFAEDLRNEIFHESESKLANELVAQFEEGIREVAEGKKSAAGLAQKTFASINQGVDNVKQRLNEKYPVVVLFTTEDLNPDGLADELYLWLREDETETRKNPRRGSKKVIRRLSDPQAQMASDIDRFAKYYAKHVIAGKQPESELRQRPKYQKGRNDYKLFLLRKIVVPRMEALVKEHIKQRTICRRFEIHDLPGPVLMNIFQRTIEKAQRILFFGTEDLGEQPLPAPAMRYHESWRIRVVVDDLNSFRNTYPEMREDPLMLPSLLFIFGREGITSLIIDTQASGSPDLSITERFDSSVRQLVQTRIYIWRLPFYGENRVAISVIPPMSHEYRGLIRELRWETKNESRIDPALIVDPHFELYSGIERAQPQPVPLEVRLYCDTPSVARYVETEERILREIFMPVARDGQESRVINPAQLHEYEPLRDASHVQRDTRLDHTTIIQVNEFWWLRRPRQRRAGAFRSQWNYLSAVSATIRGERYLSDPVVDPFWVFQLPPREQSGAADDTAKTQATIGEKVIAKRKLDFFDEECGYGYDQLKPKEEQKQYVDRVPYTWDFGFLLCNRKAWENACAPDANPALGDQELVANVWRSLRKASDKENSSETMSWRKFLQASKIVAEFQSFRTSTKTSAFDFTMRIPESFSCLILEMWFSESYQTLKRYEETGENGKRRHFAEHRSLLEEVGQRNWYSDMQNPVSLLNGLKDEKELSLDEILTERTKDKKVRCFSLELYKVWLLLTEALNFEELVDSCSHLNFEFKSRDTGPNSVSARHWYKTASNFIDSLTPEQVEYDWVPVRLPGHFSVRADWFLAVAGGSRSSRLADHALDLLSSQRANITRLQEGIGLPTRKLFDKRSGSSHLRTRLVAAPKGRALENVEYDDLRKIGAQPGKGQHFFWLWRSGIWGYNRHSRVWHKWLNRALLWWDSKHQLYNSSWSNGFDVYDRLEAIEFGKDEKASEAAWNELRKLASWSEFAELRNILIAELQQVSLSSTAVGATDQSASV